MYLNYIAILLILLILFQFLSTIKNLKEGLENKSNDNEATAYKAYSSDPLILAQHNAGNIKFLNEHMKDLIQLKNQIPAMQLDIKNIKKNITKLQHMAAAQSTANAHQSIANNKYIPKDMKKEMKKNLNKKIKK